jgi:hypothetical protein
MRERSRLRTKPLVLRSHQILRRNPALFRAAFLPEGGLGLLIAVLPFLEDVGYIAGLLNLAAELLPSEIVIINAILDGSVVPDAYVQEWAAKRGIKNPDLEQLRALKEQIRYEAAATHIQRLGLQHRHEHWCLSLGGPSAREHALIRGRIDVLASSVPTCWVIPDPRETSRPHHRAVAQAILSGLEEGEDLRPARIMCYPSFEAELRSLQENRPLEPNANYIVYSNRENKHLEELLQGVCPSREASDGSTGQFFSRYRKAVAERLGLANKFSEKLLRLK